MLVGMYHYSYRGYNLCRSLYFVYDINSVATAAVYSSCSNYSYTNTPNILKCNW